jgi:hypothetical protein
MAQRCQRITRQILRHYIPTSTRQLLIATTILITSRGSIIIRQCQQRSRTPRSIRHGNQIEWIIAQILESVQCTQLLLGTVMPEGSLGYIPK